MLVLSRQEGQQIVIGGQIVVTVVRIRGSQIRLGIEAPAEVAVRRSELPARRPPSRPEATSAASGVPVEG